MKIGGLFSGIGGFELAFTQLGGQVAWMCERDPKAAQVLRERFPNVPVYPDVRELDPYEVEPVDVLTGGSPCQGFSVAGTRSGLEHDESRLFADYVRIMNGLAERGLRWALWENVPGVLSIEDEDGERTFEHVVAALAGGTVPVRLDRGKRWNAGLASRRGRAVAWRVLDSRYFGVAQRRRRVFAAVAFGDAAEDRAVRSLLAVPEGVRRDTPPSVETREGASGGSAEGANGAGGFRMTAFGQYEDDDSASTLKQRDYKDATDLVVDFGRTSDRIRIDAETAPTLQAGGGGSGAKTGLFLDQYEEAPAYGMYGNSGQEGATAEEQPAITASHGQPGNVAVPAVMLHIRGGVERDAKGRKAGKGPLLSYELSATLDATQPWTLFEPRAFRKATRARSTEDPETWVDDGTANTLNTFDLGDTRTTQAILEPTLAAHETGQGWWNEADYAGTLRAEGENRPSRPSNVLAAQYGVRRLTPVECERLQAFPDGWTEPAGSDSARYKALGNAVTVNTVRWVLGRMLEADRTIKEGTNE